MKKVALAYSGGLDTSIIISWLKENYHVDVVAVAVDVGQAEETAGLAQKAYSTDPAYLERMARGEERRDADTSRQHARHESAIKAPEACDFDRRFTGPTGDANGPRTTEGRSGRMPG